MTNSIILQNMDEHAIKAVFAEATQQLINFNPDKFYNVIVSSEWFCKIHGISRATLSRWIREGYVIPEEKEAANSDARFRLSYILRFDIDAFKRRKMTTKLNNMSKAMNFEPHKKSSPCGEANP